MTGPKTAFVGAAIGVEEFYPEELDFDKLLAEVNSDRDKVVDFNDWVEGVEAAELELSLESEKLLAA
tara:strand:- start:99 stop:299 length:201 start_codon:yes stop_codon:yes gene_type:complete